MTLPDETNEPIYGLPLSLDGIVKAISSMAKELYTCPHCHTKRFDVTAVIFLGHDVEIRLSCLLCGKKHSVIAGRKLVVNS